MCIAAPSSVKMVPERTRKAATPNPMTAAARLEHSLVCQTIEEIIGPRLTEEVCNILYIIVSSTPNLVTV